MIYRYVLRDILNDKDVYENTKEEVKSIIFTNIDNRRKEIILNVDGDEYSLTYGNLLTLLVTFRVFVYTKCEFSELFIYDPSDSDNINDYFDNILDYTLNNLDESEFDNVKLCITDVIAELADISGTINGAYGSTISIKSMIELGKKNKEFNELIHLKLPDENLEFIEIESFVKESLNRSMNILENEPNALQDFIKSGAGINAKQLGQVINMVGNKPDLDGTIIPHPITSSFLRGLDLPSYFIVSKGARKALITNATQVRSSGYLTRKSTLACMDTHSIVEGFCDTKHTVPVLIATKKILGMFNGRSYDDNGKKVKVNSKDTSLIGKTLNIYSPMTCACENGICEVCYGNLSRFNKDINIGIVAVLLLTEPLTQNLLSTKHLLTTNSKKIEWGKDFNKYFDINIDRISYKNPKIKIIIPQENLEEDEFGENFTFTDFIVEDKKSRIEISSEMRLVINNKAMDIFEYYDEETNSYVITGLADKKIFYFIMDNIELSSSLNKIKSMIDTSDYIKGKTMEEVINELLPLIEESGIRIDSIHLETILRCLTIMKNRKGLIFEGELPEYNMYSIKEAILRGNSLTKSLTFEELLRQVSTLRYDIFSKDGSSLVDGLL